MFIYIYIHIYIYIYICLYMYYTDWCSSDARAFGHGKVSAQTRRDYWCAPQNSRQRWRSQQRYSYTYIALQHAATHRDALQQTATRCNTLQHNTQGPVKVSTALVPSIKGLLYTSEGVVMYNVLQHTATHCSTLQTKGVVVRRCCALQ